MTQTGHRHDGNPAMQQSPAAARCVIFQSEAPEALIVKRREFIRLIGGAAVAWPLAARAQQDPRLLQITVWMARANDAEGLRHAAALREGLQALGWTNGRNVRIDYRWVTGDIDRVSLAKEIVEQQPDVILVESTAAVAALSRASSTIPIVFVNVGDPIEVVLWRAWRGLAAT